MINAKSELLLEIEERCILCAELYCNIEMRNILDNVTKHWCLKIGYTKNEYEQFLNSLDIEYDNGFGCQHLFGTVWFDDNTWLERDEYDGSEWWILKKFPEIPEHLMLKNNGNK